MNYGLNYIKISKMTKNIKKNFINQYCIYYDKSVTNETSSFFTVPFLQCLFSNYL